MATHYETLGVPEDSTQEEIRAAYRRLIRIHHPDIAGPEGALRTGEINHAHQILGDRDSRILYDSDLRRERNLSAPASDYVVFDDTVHDRTTETWVQSPQEDYDDRLRFVDYWDHPVTRRKLIMGIAGIALLGSGALVATSLSNIAALVSVGAAVLFGVLPKRSWLVALASVGLGVLSAYQTASPWGLVLLALVLSSLYLTRQGAQTFIGVMSGLSDDRRRRAQIRRDQKEREKDRLRAEREREYQRQAEERRRARQQRRADRRRE